MTVNDLKDFSRWLSLRIAVWLLVLYFGIALIGRFSVVPASKEGPIKKGSTVSRDNTDPVDGPRSGLVLYTDALTGCQYLGLISGGLTPRRNGVESEHVGCKK